MHQELEKKAPWSSSVYQEIPAALLGFLIRFNSHEDLTGNQWLRQTWVPFFGDHNKFCPREYWKCDLRGRHIHTGGGDSRKELRGESDLLRRVPIHMVSPARVWNLRITVPRVYLF
jgi:hypothetical protein